MGKSNDPENKPLNDKEKVFVEVYLATFSWTEAYKAGFNPKMKSSNTNAYHVAKRPHVAKELERRMAEVLGERQIVANKYLAKLDSIAMADLYDEKIDVRTQIDAMKVLLTEMARIESKGKPTGNTIKISLED